MTPIKINLQHWANHCKDYIAEIIGTDPKFTFRREFIRPFSRNWSRSGKGGNTDFIVDKPGIYEIQEPSTGVYGGEEARRYFRLNESGEVVKLSKDEVLASFGVNGQKPISVEV